MCSRHAEKGSGSIGSSTASATMAATDRAAADAGRTWFDATMIAMPMGRKMRPSPEKSITTFLGVRIGRHTLSFCCLKAELSGRCF